MQRGCAMKHSTGIHLAFHTNARHTPTRERILDSISHPPSTANDRITARRVARGHRSGFAATPRFGLRALGTLERNARRVVVTSVALLLTSCSSLRLGYNNADTLLVYGLDFYLELNDKQIRLAQERILALLAWHRQTQLPQYAQLLQRAQGTFSGEVSADDLLALRSEIDRQLLVLAERAAPDIAALALTLTPEQIDHSERYLTEQAAKAQRELAPLTAPQLQEQREERQIQRAQWWFGELTKSQLATLRAAVADRTLAQDSWREERERRQREFVVLLRQIQREQPPPETAARQLRDYLAQLIAPVDAARAHRARAYRASEASLHASLIAGASIKQRSMLLRRLRDYAEDIAALSVQQSDSDS